MKTVLNLLWLVLVGVWSAIGWLLSAAMLAVLVVTLPAARQCLKFAHFTLWPFGRQAVASPTAYRLGTLGNVLWFIPGLFLAVVYFVGGALLCLTVIGIPFGMQSFKFAGLALAPFGKEIARTKDRRSGQSVAQKGQAMGVVAERGFPAPPQQGDQRGI